MIANNRYENMSYVKCGDSGLYLPKLCLGIWNNFGKAYPYENSREMILTAFNLGINHIDAANNYGPPPGSAEEVLGEVLRRDLKGYRDELVISTKAGYCLLYTSNVQAYWQQVVKGLVLIFAVFIDALRSSKSKA